jgi:hypothetical protein
MGIKELQSILIRHLFAHDILTPSAVHSEVV